jgi:hypothetical protein
MLASEAGRHVVHVLYLVSDVVLEVKNKNVIKCCI